MSNIQFLKKEGHDLLELYISLDPNRHGGVYKEKSHAYRKLEKKLRRHHNAHFSMMTTEQEVIHAISKLRGMIKKRKERIKREEKLKEQNRVAPNVRELQRKASELNKELIV